MLMFDFDGTIADTFNNVLTIMNRLSIEYNFRKIESHEIEQLKDKTTREILRYLEISMIKAPIIGARLRRELHKEINVIKPKTGLKEVLLQLQSSGHKMGILTSNSKKNVAQFLKNHELVFDFITTSLKIGGKIRRLKAIMHNEGLQPNDILYIGDEIRDIKSAKKVSIRIAAVTWGYNSEKALKAHKPDFLVTRPEELFKICNMFCP